MPKSKGPKKPAAAAPQSNPDEQPKLPRVWSVVFYSEQEVHLVTLCLALLELGAVQSSDHPLRILEQIALQEQTLQTSTNLVNENGGREWVKAVRRRFSELVVAIEKERQADR